MPIKIRMLRAAVLDASDETVLNDWFYRNTDPSQKAPEEAELVSVIRVSDGRVLIIYTV